MKSCLGLILALLVMAILVGSGALIWHLSESAEFTRNSAPAAGTPARR